MKQKKGYTEMKDSGVEWISQIPTDWQVKRLKEQFSFGKGLPITKADLVDSGVAVISYGQIHAKSNTGTHLAESLLRYVPKTFLETNPSAILRKGDIVLADTSEDLDGIGNAVLMDIDETVFAGYHTIILHPSKADFSKYLSYLFQTDNWRSQLRANASGIKVFSVTQKMLRSCSFILPPKSVRDAITTYLDTQCAKIDEIIAQAKASIEDYKQWKASIIYEAVTKGLDPNVEMKESGVPWIGKCPYHWAVSAMKTAIDILPGYAFPSEDFSQEGIALLRGINVAPGYIRWNDVVYWAKDINKNISNYYLREGDIVVGLDRPWNAEGTRVAVIRSSDLPCLLLQRVCRIRSKGSVDLRFIFHCINGPTFNEAISTETTGISVPHISTKQIEQFLIALPPFKEQIDICNYLDKKCASITEIISQKQSLINELESYKKFFIYEVVTGKRRVF